MSVVNIARCPEHGLHGERTECFICGADVEQVEMAPAADLLEAIEAIDDLMGYDKGPNEDEYVEWCNRYLPLVKRYGRQKYTIDFS